MSSTVVLVQLVRCYYYHRRRLVPPTVGLGIVTLKMMIMQRSGGDSHVETSGKKERHVYCWFHFGWLGPKGEEGRVCQFDLVLLEQIR